MRCWRPLAARSVKRRLGDAPALYSQPTPHRPRHLPAPVSVAKPERKITAISHSWSGNLPGGTPKQRAQQSEYSTPGRIVINTGSPRLICRRTPCVRPAKPQILMALEIAIDELAEKAGIDPRRFASE